jgi:MYND finger
LDGIDHVAQAAVFDVIDTSNLSDHVGLLNVLVHSLPLLKNAITSTLFTEILVHPANNDKPVERLSRLLCGDLSKLFCLLGITPTGVLTGITTISSGFEEMPLPGASLSNVRQQLWRIAWKYPTNQEAISFASASDEERGKVRWHDGELASTLSDLYDRMFPHEDPAGLLQRISTVNNPLSVITPFHYNRASFGAFVRFLRDRVLANWSLVFSQFLEKVLSRRSTVDMDRNSVQDLYLQLHRCRAFTSKVLAQNPRAIGRCNFPLSWPAIFRENTSPDTITCIIFKVPRSQLSPIMNRLCQRKSGVEIAFEIHVTSLVWENIFSSFQITFGDIDYSWEDGSYIIEEDRKRWFGVSDLLISVPLPTFILLQCPPEEIKISLRLQRNAIVSNAFMSELGFKLMIHHAALPDRSQIFPIPTQNINYHPVQESPSSSESGAIVSPALTVTAPIIAWNPTAKATIRINVVGINQKKALSSGADVSVEQHSPYTAIVNCGESIRQLIAFPVPIDGGIRLRIARKSGWIEVVTPVAIADASGKSRVASIIRHSVTGGDERSQRSKLMLPRLNLDIIPQIKLGPGIDLSWININAGSMFSNTERRVREQHLKDQTSNDVLVDVKEGLYSLFACALGGGPRKKFESVFFLDAPSIGGVQTIIFLVGIKLDVLSGTVVADSFVLPLTKSIVRDLSQELRFLSEYGMNLYCTPDAYKYWKMYLTACVERSRTWKHKCSLKTGQKTPHDNQEQSFLCACGMGRVVPAFRQVKAWSKFTPYVTRAGITPLFSVPYMESIMPTDVASKVDGILEQGMRLGSLDIDICRACGERGLQLMWCSRCKSVKYCSQSCQRKDWKKHKANCRAI